MPQVRCKICSKEFYGKPSHIKRGWAKFCSKVCQNKSQMKGKYVNCEECGEKTWRMPKELRSSKSNKFFCSKSCQTIWRNKFFSGSKHSNWKGGNFIYKRVLLEHDNSQICVRCGEKDKRVVVVHHKDKNRKNNDIENLVWLCFNCHHLVHQYDEFIE